MEAARLSRGDWTHKPGALMVVLVAGCFWGAAACLGSAVANAQTAEKVYTRADYTDWLNKYANASERDHHFCTVFTRIWLATKELDLRCVLAFAFERREVWPILERTQR
jgi:hypothetical protein